MRNIFFLLTTLLLTSFQKTDNVRIDKVEAKKAFVLLNDIRANPEKYYKQFSFLEGLEITNTELSWNDTLAKVAQAKALDMARRNYFDHVNPDGYGLNYFINKSGYKLNQEWLENIEDNYFESAGAGVPNGASAIRGLIIDKGDPLHGHRKHLLGIEDWNASLVDIGIGFARRDSGSRYKTYVSVIIAKHDW